MNKICSKCGIEKDVSEFHFSKKYSLGRDNSCKNCKSLKHKEDVSNKNIDRICPSCGKITKINKFQLHNIDIGETTGKCMKCSNGKNGKRLGVGEAAFNHLFDSYARKGIERGYSFELKEDEFRKLTKENCHYCGKEPSNIWKKKLYNGFYIYNGIDRKDNSKGYTIDNCVACCGMCNISKHHHGYEEYKEWIKRSYLHLFS